MMLDKLRRAVDERIPQGGSESDTNYSDSELQSYLDEYHGNLNYAAAEIWLEKAASATAKKGEVSNYAAGSESYSYVKASEAYDHAMAMHQLYRSRAQTSRIISTGESRDSSTRPKGLGDITRLTQDQVGW